MPVRSDPNQRPNPPNYMIGRGIAALARLNRAHSIVLGAILYNYTSRLGTGGTGSGTGLGKRPRPSGRAAPIACITCVYVYIRIYIGRALKFN